MIITSVKYGNKEQTSLLVNGEMNVPWPCETWHAEFIQAWLDEPNTIDPYRSLQEIKDAKKEEINRWRDAAKIEAVTYNSVIYDADLMSQANLNSTLTSIQAGVTVPDPLTWRAADNTNQSLTHAQLTGLSGFIFAQVNDAYAHSWTLKADVDAAADETAVEAITW